VRAAVVPLGGGALRLYDYAPAPDRLLEDVVEGLSLPRKALPPKYFYDEAGARLFERICELDAYYPTRTEIGILERSIGEIATALGPAVRLVEFGSGSGVKTRLLLEHLERPTAYMPIDISREQLAAFALSVAAAFPGLDVAPVCADYTSAWQLPRAGGDAVRTIVFFPGSTIGNFERAEAAQFLRRTAALCGEAGGLLLGVDLRKSPALIERAYNDPEGVTAAFNLNLLRRINRECDADFDLQAFTHHAPYDAAEGRIEMRLVSRRAQTVEIGRGLPGGPLLRAEFRAGEHIVTEYSHKYTPEGFAALAAEGGWRVERGWTDERGWFGVFLLAVSG
jgi:dimethylhistidine N-methyltransferase